MNKLNDGGDSIEDQAYWRHRSVLITGATGFIGANLVRRLQGLQAKVHVMLRPGTSTWRINNCLDSLNRVVADLGNYKNVEQVFEQTNPDVIFHLATARGTHDKSRLRYVETNILGAVNLIECLSQRPSSRLIMAGSSLEYAPSEGPISETHPLGPKTVHGAVKLAAGALATQAVLSENLAISQLRIFHVYGPWESVHRFLPQAILHALEGRPMPLVEGLSRRDWVHVDDVVRALLMAAAPHAPVGIFNVGSGREHSNDDVLNAMESVLSLSVARQIAALPKRPTDSEHRYANIELTGSALGWYPRFDLAQGIKNTLDWHAAFPHAWRTEQGVAPVTH